MKNNPYVGLRAFQKEDQHFYGRAREERDLTALIIAEKIVLFYAQSGVGKTSLLNAKIIPALQEHKFRVLRTRVGMALAKTDAKFTKNIFIHNLISNLESELSDPQITDINLSDCTLLNFLQYLGVDKSHPSVPVLIIDQFEEIFTTYRDHWQDIAGFFQQIREALDALPKLGVVFTLREDYIAHLDAYISYIPESIHGRFRMERLSTESALDAISEPASHQKHPFASKVAEELVQKLSRITYASGETDGPDVEPVLLQIVCQQLWDKLPDNTEKIQSADVEAYGNVNDALVKFYKDTLGKVLEQTKITEKDLRKWITDNLITPDKKRKLIQETTRDTGGIPPEALAILSTEHFIIPYEQRGVRWYELVHDLLIDPVWNDNDAWLGKNLSLLQKQAELWNEQDRSVGLLLSGDALKEAETWAEAHTNELNQNDKAFLQACRLERTSKEFEQQRAKELQHTNSRRLWLAIGATLLTLIMMRLVGVAWEKTQVAKSAQVTAETAREHAEEQTRLTNIHKTATKALAILTLHSQQSMLLAAEAYTHCSTLKTMRIPAVEETMHQVLAGTGGMPLIGHNAYVNVVAFSPDGRWLITAGNDGARRWDLTQSPSESQILSGIQGSIHTLIFTKAPSYMALAGASGDIYVWNWNAWELPPIILTGTTEIDTVTFSPDGMWLASSHKGSTEIQLWHTTEWTTTSLTLTGHSQGVTALGFSSDGQWLAAGSLDATVRLWNMAEITSSLNTYITVTKILTDGLSAIHAIAISPQNDRLVAARENGTMDVWALNEPGIPLKAHLSGHSSRITRLMFDAKGDWLVSAGWNYSALLWDAKNLNQEAEPIALHGHEYAINDIAFDHSGRQLATASADSTIRIWDLGNLRNESIVLRGHDTGVKTVAFNPQDSSQLVSGEDKSFSVRLWNWRQASSDPVILKSNGDLGAAAFSPDGRWFATAKRWEKTVELWDMENRKHAPIIVEGHTQTILDLTFSVDGQWLLTGSEDDTARLWSLRAVSNTERITQSVVITGHHDGVEGVAFGLNNRWIATAGQDGLTRLWDISALKSGVVDNFSISLTIVLGQPSGIVNAVAFSVDGHWLATGVNNATTCLWDIPQIMSAAQDGTWLTATITLTRAKGAVTDVAFSPDGKWLAATGNDKITQLWHTDQFELPNPTPILLQRHESAVTAVAFSPGTPITPSRWIATAGGWDRTAQFWDLTNLESDPVTLYGHNYVEDVTFSPDGTWLATTSRDQRVRLWYLQADQLYTLLCNTVGRNLTSKEWEWYFGDESYRETCPITRTPED
ncbi:MAG: PD40 domain-containing protein [Anaerolineae bacterium]|nr:PD40 domain-containing protein [Anaerolineae bacterium]